MDSDMTFVTDDEGFALQRYHAFDPFRFFSPSLPSFLEVCKFTHVMYTDLFLRAAQFTGVSLQSSDEVGTGVVVLPSVRVIAYRFRARLDGLERYCAPRDDAFSFLGRNGHLKGFVCAFIDGLGVPIFRVYLACTLAVLLRKGL